MSFLRLFLFLSLILPAGVRAQVGFPVKNIHYLDSTQLTFRVFSLKQKSIVIFSDGGCLWNPVPTPNCFLFEKQLDNYGEVVRKKGWKIYGIDIGFRNLEILDHIAIRSRPTVKVFKEGVEILSVDRLDNVYHNTPWQEELILRLLNDLE